MAWTAIEFAEGFKYLVDGDGRLETVRCPQRGTGSDRRCIGRPRRQNGALLGYRQRGMRHHVSWMIEDGPGVQQRGDVENIVIESGRRPHGLLHSLDEVRCRASDDARHTPEVNESGRLGLDLMDVVGGRSGV